MGMNDVLCCDEIVIKHIVLPDLFKQNDAENFQKSNSSMPHKYCDEKTRLR